MTEKSNRYLTILGLGLGFVIILLMNDCARYVERVKSIGDICSYTKDETGELRDECIKVLRKLSE